MIDIKNRVSNVTDREVWAARGASFVAKLKATKVVWFPPEPVETGRKSTDAAKKTTRKASKKASKKATGAAKKTTSAAKKTAGATKKE